MLTVINQKISERSTVAKHKLGAQYQDESGNIYTYCLGVASNTAGSFVVFDEAFATTLLVADEVGPVGISMSAFVANEYGWVQVYGVNTAAKTDTVAADTSAFIDGTAGRVDDAGVAGDAVLGCLIMTADTTNVATVFLNHPYVTNSGYLT